VLSSIVKPLILNVGNIKQKRIQISIFNIF
jgi:hypothetical protein